jgi:hypothetical protein
MFYAGIGQNEPDRAGELIQWVFVFLGLFIISYSITQHQVTHPRTC